MPNNRVNVVRNRRLIQVAPRRPSEEVARAERMPEPVPQTEAVRIQLAEQDMLDKWKSLGGAPGEQKTIGTAGLIRAGQGFYREYTNGRIYSRHGSAAFYVYGAIGNRYIELNGTDSWLGWPTSDEQPFAEGGRATMFQNGAIYWWPDTGAIDLKDIAVRYTGLVCFGETDSEQDLGGLAPGASDEPYVFFGVVAAEISSSPATPIYEDVDAGESRADNIEMYRGLPVGMAVSAVLMEHDTGNPDTYREGIRKGVEEGAKRVAQVVAYVPYVGPFIAPIAEEVLKEIGPEIVEALNDVLDTKDDHIGTVTFQVTAKEMVTMARRPLITERGIQHHKSSPLITGADDSPGAGASYKVYVAVQAV
jgi:hypothetical protein